MAAAIDAGAHAPEFCLPATDGGVVRFTRGGGEDTFLLFWKSTCPNSRALVPKLADVFRAHPNAAARVVGVAVGTDTCETAAEFQQATGFTFPTGVDEQGEVRTSYQLKRVPSVILVDPTGIVLRKYIGNRDEFAPAVDTALDAIEKGISIPSYDLEGGG